MPPQDPSEQLLARQVGSSPGNFSLYRPLPVLAVERCEVEASEVHAIEASDVHVDFVGIGSRDVERVHAADLTEMVFRRLCIEIVRRKVIFARNKIEILRQHDQVDEALLRTDRAVAESGG